jgi:regulator of protease activity HflC (stomatin/prohibitin superfamily)
VAQNSLGDVIGQRELDELLARRDQVNEQMQAIIDEQTASWGVKVGRVEIKDVGLV